MTHNDPRTWTAPAGPRHPDFDPAVEIEMLRRFSLLLQEAAPDVEAVLVITAPGYMRVDFLRHGRRIGNVLVAHAGYAPGKYLYDFAGPDDDAFGLEFCDDDIASAVEAVARRSG